MSQALFCPSDFLTSGNAPASYTADTYTDRSCTTAESAEKPEFSEYLAALDEKAGIGGEAPDTDEAAAAPENETVPEEALTVVAVESILTLFSGKIAPRGEEAAPDTEDLALSAAEPGSAGEASEPVPDEAANSPSRTPGPSRLPDTAEAGEEQAAVVEKNSAMNGHKTLSDDGNGKPENKPKESGEIRDTISGEDVYFDEKSPVIREEPELGWQEDGLADSGAETASVTAKTLDSENPVDQEALTFKGADILVRAAGPRTDEKSPVALAGGGEKALSGRTRRNTAAERARSDSGAEAERSGTEGATVRGAGTQEFRRVGAVPETEITVNFRGGEPRSAAAGEAGGSGVFGGAKQPASFETFLARELQENLNGDIVRQARVLLREGGEGTIRLSLKPESLGKVKIRLEMTENKITGKIVVESGEALRAFEREMESLEQTFRSEGFDGASLSLELAEHREPGGSEGEWPPGGGKISSETASSRYDENAGNGAYFGAAYSAKQINVLV
ncbi:MAG: flagellar hook-length control protein FliK [Spirochaetaceae bacterium]|nr:flagellar hook-length control protein FliK [Spirochaetaceae bacterium]